MALVDLYFDIKNQKLVRSSIDEGSFRIANLYQEDTLEINLWVYQRDYTKMFGTLFTIQDVSALDCFISIGDAGSVLASQSSFTKINNNQTFYGKLSLNTSGINTALSSSNPVTKTFEIRLFKAPDVYYRTAFQVVINKSVALAAAATTPATSPGLSQTEAAATYVPFDLPAGRSIGFTSEDGTKKGVIYLHNDGTFRIPGIT